MPLAARAERRVPLALLGAGLVALAVVRLAAAGWAGVAPDDARYLYVGLSVLDGQGPLTPDGSPFTLRSPVYGVLLAVGARLTSGLASSDLLLGARLVSAGLSLLGLLGAVRLAWLLGGRRAAVVTTIVLAALPLVWRLVPTLRIDLVQTAGIVAVLLLMRQATVARWLAAGAVLGLTVLVKESALLLGALPLAWPARDGRRAWLAGTGAFVAAAAMVAGWWWLVVWIDSGAIFPANALAVIERRDVAAGVEVGPAGLLLAAAIAVSWSYVALRSRAEPGLRPLAAALALLLPPATYAFVNGLDARNYAGVAVLGAVAVGIAASRVAWRPDRRTTGVAVAAALAVCALGQAEAGAAYDPPIPAQLSAWLGQRVGGAEKVVMTFRFRALVAVELYGRTTVEELRPARVQVTDDPADYVWMGLRDRQLFGYRRGAWIRMLADPAVRYLAIAEPHFFAPVELEPFLGSGAGAGTGLRIVERLRPAGPTATILAVDPAEVANGTSAIPLHLSPEALDAWLELSGGDAERVAASGAIVSGPASAPGICGQTAGPPYPDGWQRLVRCP